ncbi:MAG: peptidoglycan DD-metalloendopeptidase family protein [Janthinobacterium lividum]
MPPQPPTTETEPCCCSDEEEAYAGRAGVISRRSLLRGASIGGLAVAAGVTLPPLAAFAAPNIDNPFAGRTITQTWAQHQANGSLGGIDFAMPVGSPLPACGAGTITNVPNDGTGGNTVVIDLGGGWKSHYLHLSKFTTNGLKVAQKDVVGWSGGARGAPGAGSSTGPHCHWHLIDPNGVRVNPLEHLTSGGGSTGLPKTSAEQDGAPGTVFYRRMQNWLRLTEGYDGPIDGAPGKNTYAALQSAMRDYGYTGPIDGVMGASSWKAVQRLAATRGYDGPIDGAMGPSSWRGFAAFLNDDKWD